MKSNIEALGFDFCGNGTLMSVDQPAVVDFRWKDEANNRAVLTISDHLDWEEEGEHLLLLQDKLNHYLEFIESGQLIEAKPEFKGLPVLIHVAAQYPLSGQAAKFYERAKERAADFGCSLEFDLGATSARTNKEGDRKYFLSLDCSARARCRFHLDTSSEGRELQSTEARSNRTKEGVENPKEQALLSQP